ncbi:right-handed parallel beta-helix repeat-containing protein [Massilia sp. CF038]|uniref:right-handed parallel beta-helix repeat-containing protein n=1 Tax=Massilia sp. CF038 TaxID=1881045 RepID=UPI000923E651|nr:right-handed parallel beta-helix repeat-containing protein [Massilia sp. CF038]SHH41848.1 hypothetical protein SAMN05428948_3932 [Massilia sp. CF038]
MARALRWLAALLLLGLLAAGVAAFVLQQQSVTPRALAPYIEKRSSGHNPLITGLGQWSADLLVRLDRGDVVGGAPAIGGVGARAAAVPAPAAGTVRLVSTSDDARRALAEAAPGDVITFLPGVYRFERTPLTAGRAGTALAPIVVRAAAPGSVTIEMDLAEGFQVSAPHWYFENLTIRGTCKVQANCEHAFHVVGAAADFRARNNTIVDFNAHFKINGMRGQFPDHGRIEDNTLRNDSVRETMNPVTLIDLVAASHWRIRRNQISDFVKGSGDRISYGAFAKGAGSDNIFEQNLVLCEARLQGLPGQRVGLSLGGGGTGKDYCRDKRCIVEQEKSEIRANLISACSDDGIYINSAAASKVTHNTLLDTGGIQVRFPASSADIEGNLIDGDIRARNGGAVRLIDNKTTPIALLYAGYHPVRSLFANPAAFNFSWSGEPPRRERGADFVPDLCGAVRATTLSYGAFDDIAACFVQKD